MFLYISTVVSLTYDYYSKELSRIQDEQVTILRKIEGERRREAFLHDSVQVRHNCCS